MTTLCHFSTLPSGNLETLGFQVELFAAAWFRLPAATIETVSCRWEGER